MHDLSKCLASKRKVKNYTTVTDRVSLFSSINRFSGSEFWSGWWDASSEGEYVDVNDASTSLSSTGQLWLLGEPNGRREENCAAVWVERAGWRDVECDSQLCGFCQMKETPVITMRGWFLVMEMMLC